jgi:ribosomal protein L11 methyltransferase
VIDPGRAFGTGAHPTTQLVLELLQELPPGSLLDVGCGSGVLSIAAGRLGFAPILGLDDDPAAIEASRENARVNEVRVDVRLGDALTDALPAVDVVVANIALDVVEALLPHLRAAHVVASGYLEQAEPRAPGWERVERRAADGWAADLLEPI